MQFSKSGPSNPHRPNPPPPIKTTKPPQPTSHLTPLPNNPKFGMPASLLSGLNMGTYSSATAPSTTHSLSFQPQFPPTPPPQPTIPPFTTYSSYTPSFPNPNIPPYSSVSAFSQATPSYPPNTSQYYYHTPNRAQSYYPRQYTPWPDPNNIQPITTTPTYHCPRKQLCPIFQQKLEKGISKIG
jgi:hypothetical protein